MILHKLKEVRAIADKITVVRDGSTICTIYCREKKPTEAEIIRDMIGREMSDIYPKRPSQMFGNVCFEIRDWRVEGIRKERIILDHVNMKVRRGEILMNGQPVDTKDLKPVIESGIGYVSEDRKGNGLVLMQDIKYNTTIEDLPKQRGANVGSLLAKISINKNEEIKVAEEFRRSLTIKTPSVEHAVDNISGGNQQKVQLAKWLFVEPKLLILDSRHGASMSA